MTYVKMTLLWTALLMQIVKVLRRKWLVARASSKCLSISSWSTSSGRAAHSIAHRHARRTRRRTPHRRTPRRTQRPWLRRLSSTLAKPCRVSRYISRRTPRLARCTHTSTVACAVAAHTARAGAAAPQPSTMLYYYSMELSQS